MFSALHFMIFKKQLCCDRKNSVQFFYIGAVQMLELLQQ